MFQVQTGCSLSTKEPNCDWNITFSNVIKHKTWFFMGAFHIMASLRRTELLNGLQLYLTFLFYILIISGPVLPHEPKYTLVMDFFVHYFFGFITLSPEQHMVNSSCKIPHCKSKFGQSGCEIWNILLTENTLISDVKANQTCFLVYCTST